MTLEQSLIRLMQENEKLKENDRKLILKEWEREGLKLTPHQEQVFMCISSPESIRRTRQKIQEKGMCQPSAQVKRLRRKREAQVRQAAREEKTPILQTFIDLPPTRPDVWSNL